jgi:hypothetical protein
VEFRWDQVLDFIYLKIFLKQFIFKSDTKKKTLTI